MRILVTNDDGIYAPGLWALATALRELGHVCVVAPDRDMSGIGTAMTLLEVVRVRQIPPKVDGVEAYLVQGTPADCVILATGVLYDEPFDLLVSGINSGSNMGLDVLSSGTVGGALQGYYLNIPSIAISVASLTDVQYEVAARTAAALARALANSPMPGPLLLNVNLPNVEPAGIERVEITRLGPRAYLENVERGHDGRRTHYWIKHNKLVDDQPTKGTDTWAVRNNRISITPIELVLTNRVPSRAWSAVADEVRSVLGLR